MNLVQTIIAASKRGSNLSPGGTMNNAALNLTDHHKKLWEPDEDERLIALRNAGHDWHYAGRELARSSESCRNRYNLLTGKKETRKKRS